MKEHQLGGKGWKERQERHEERREKEANLLKECCQSDDKLYDFVNKTLYLDPTGGIFDQSIDVLTQEGVASGDFRPAVDKAIFEGSQKPAERERYIRIIRDLASKTINEAELELKTGGHDFDHTEFLKRRIENRKFLSERAEDILNVASKFYKERLEEMARREQWRKEKEEAGIKAKAAEELEKAERLEKRDN